MLLRTQVLQRAADDAIEFGDLARDVAESVVRTVHAAAERGDAFAVITVFGFVARKLDAPEVGEAPPRDKELEAEARGFRLARVG